MANLSFYTNLNNTRKQTNGNGFGPLDTSLASYADFYSYRLGSMHRSFGLFEPSPDFATLPPAIAAFDGTVCFIESRFKDGGENNGKSYFHAILKPDNDTINVFPKVRYVIYRMLYYDGLFSNTPVFDNSHSSSKRTHFGSLLKASDPSELNILEKIWDSYGDNPQLKPCKHHLGTTRLKFLQDLYDNDMSKIFIDDLFYYDFSSEVSFLDDSNPDAPIKYPFTSLMRVKAGDTLGRFLLENTPIHDNVMDEDTTESFFSVDFMLDSPTYNPTIKDLFYQTKPSNLSFDENIHNQIHIPKENSLTAFQLDALKMQCINYIDPIAYYGIVLKHNQIPDVKEQHTIWHAGNSYVDAGLFYNQVLVGENSSGNLNAPNNAMIVNRNRVYIDIRDRFGLPYSFYRDKDGTDSSAGVVREQNNLALSIDNAPVVPIDYNDYNFSRKVGNNNVITDTDMFQWPILILDYDTGVTVNYNNSGSNDEELEQVIGFKHAENVDGFNSVINIAFPNFDYDKQENFLFFDDVSREDRDSDIFQGELPITPLSINPFCQTRSINIATSTVHEPISTYIKIRHIEYFKEIIGTDWYNSGDYSPLNENYPIPLFREKTNYLDFLFPVEMKDKYKNYINGNGTKTHVTSSVWYDQAYIDNSLVSGRDFVGHAGIATDAWEVGSENAPESDAKVTLFAFDSIPTIACDMTTEVIIQPDPPTQITESNIQIEFSVPEFDVKRVDARSKFYQELTNDRLRTISFSTKSIHPDPNNPGTTVRVDLISNMSATNRNFDTRAWVDTGFRRTEDFVYIGISKSDYDEIMNDIYPDQFLNNTAYIKGTPVYWGFNVVNSGVEEEIEWIKFEITLNGYKNVGGHPQLVRYATGKFIYESVDTLNMRNFNIPDAPNSKGFTIFTTANPISNSAPPIEIIHSNVYLAKSPDISYEEFIRYSNYYRSNIRHVFNTSTNKGLTAAVRIDNTSTNIGNLPITNVNEIFTENQYTESYQQVNQISADEVHVYHATPMQFKMLKENEIILMVQGNVPDERSSIARGGDDGELRRHGRMCFLRRLDGSTVAGKYFEENTAAHEFGHVMSLADRYTQLARMSPTANKLDNSAYNSPRLYLSSNYDPDYGADFRWLNNLMSVDYNVPLNDQGEIYTDNVHADYWLRMDEFKSTSNDPNVFGHIFITPNQWARIVEAGCASGPSPSEAFESAFQGRDATYILPNNAGENYMAFFGIDTSNNYISDRANDNTGSDRIHNHVMADRAAITSLAGYIDPYRDLHSNSDDYWLLRSIPSNRENTQLLELGITKKKLLENHRTAIEGGLGEITIAILNNTIQTTHTDYNSPMEDLIDGDAVGDAVWNYLEICPMQTLSIRVEKTDKVPIMVNFTYTIKFSNRVKILTNG